MNCRQRLFFCFFLFGTSLFTLQAQDLGSDDFIDHHVLIQLTTNEDPHNWLKTYQRSFPDDPELQYVEKLGIGRNIHLFHAALPVDDALLNKLRRQPQVLALQPNGFVEFRSPPNDPLFSTQWHLPRIGLDEVWNESTGGLTADGDTIVVAIMDRGFDIYHEDLVDNLWYNRGEIPGDSIDNDGNGYIDDLHGWDYQSGTPEIAVNYHGAGVAGIIGASGNNSQGVSGINWNIKLMYFSFVRIDRLIGAFEYVIDQRTRYNNSNGSEGSFVVAVNNSFGVNNIFCEPPPNAVYELWRQSYDLMGEVGVLSAASAANGSSDVDQAGDMPTTCKSEYLIGLCNVNEDDNLSSSASYGATSIDLAAPGDGSMSTNLVNTYTSFGQNSAAAPHLAGTIALLYSIPCSNLGQIARQEPQVMARLIRDVILQGVEPLRSLEGKTVTGGLLRADNSWTLLQETLCPNPLGELTIGNLYPNPADQPTVTLEYLTPENGSYQLQLYNALGQFVRAYSLEVPMGGLRSTQFSVADLPQGVYFLRLGKGKDWVSKRVIVME